MLRRSETVAEVLELLGLGSYCWFGEGPAPGTCPRDLSPGMLPRPDDGGMELAAGARGSD